jgi:tetratricopeptide (TPR) repeat protein
MAHRILKRQIIQFSVPPLVALFALRPCLALAQTEPARSRTAEGAKFEDPNAKAKRLMGEGNALYAKRDFEGAHQKFLEAWAIKQHIAIASNLVETEMKLGHYAEAAIRLRSLLSSMPIDDKEDRTAFMTQLAECRHHLIALHITVSEDGATVKVGDMEVGKSPLDSEVLVEPGPTKITAELRGYQSAMESTDGAAAGETKNINLTLIKEAPQPATPTPAVSATTSPSPEAPHRGIEARTVVLIGGTALAVAGVGLGFVYWGMRANTDSDASQIRASIGSNGCGNQIYAAQCAQLRTDANRYDNQSRLMAGLLIGGGVAAATTIATYFLWPSRKASGADSVSTKTAFVPWSSPNSAGLNVVHQF